ncbi:peptide-methionine (S)-S-oxide reductase MsrA [Candidatus Rhabdochlamydia sp. T3358]|uniref:peptide-methionine (S)-S-oxide reductase MsrA n=1 Tax=Candidatus Rhabdochlamydia sp. T3358 TaxID=2099795 RepID=UPI0010B3E3F5|nr:peptide-methionine (S)-S-oxide reductase MsrA [Candidatus Rhabdochlamydia sp. T3358]VHO04937.1 Peptide methionine sulfoxide reductase MsrA [Candidatus Rhabdochlamydia sp. T3358]
MLKKKIHWVWKILNFAFFCCLVPVHGQEAMDKNFEIATFAGGCFWLVQHNFNQIDGVVSTKVGYTGGDKLDPCYEEVCCQKTGHFEAVQVVYHSQKISYEELLEAYWKMIDPTRDDGQFEDSGPQYRPAIFYHNLDQKETAERSKQALIQSKQFPQVLVQILPEAIFYVAEDYHQNYLDRCE